VLPVFLPVVQVVARQLLRLDNQKVFRVLLLCRPRKIERAGDDSLTVDDDYPVMSDGVFVVDEGRDAGIGQERSRRILFCALALVQDDFHRHSPFVSIDEGFGDRRRGERVRLYEDLQRGVIDLSNNGLSQPLRSERSRALWAR